MESEKAIEKIKMNEDGNERKTFRIRVYGVVQGVGFRPTVSRHAMESGICGNVCNKGPYVEIIAQGKKIQTERFLEKLNYRKPWKVRKLQD